MLLAILGCDAIALPLSPAFPAGELQYILDNSQAKVVLATEKYAEKVQGVVQAGLQYHPLVDVRQKLAKGASGHESVSLEDSKRVLESSAGGLMLYTSGTTNRPVSHPRTSRSWMKELAHWTGTKYEAIERSLNS